METTIESRRRLRGTKRACPDCAERFYDLGRDPVACPACKMEHPLSFFVPPAAPASAPFGRSSPWGRSQNALTPVARKTVSQDHTAAAGSETDEADDDATADGEDDQLLEIEDDADDQIAQHGSSEDDKAD